MSLEGGNAHINKVTGTYVHKKLINIICMKTSIKHLDIVTDIMDKINETTIAEHDADKTQPITDQFNNVINTVTDTLSDRITHLNYYARKLAPRAVPNGKEKTYILIVEEIKEVLQQRQDGKICSTLYTFPEDQFDLIIDQIQAIISTAKAH
ncbi:MAG: hypothetical protein EZS28_014006 [Streblomastix strix]|uniref:Uncharacterized protein n=1 Tax=Streblomastix strix TaxID=222440 RepID=A0A5J4W6W5_9EUKA|nr:MAG: hypothetical protein EZS28_014006 [Streblomastix strix]